MGRADFDVLYCLRFLIEKQVDASLVADAELICLFLDHRSDSGGHVPLQLLEIDQRRLGILVHLDVRLAGSALPAAAFVGFTHGVADNSGKALCKAVDLAIQPVDFAVQVVDFALQAVEALLKSIHARLDSSQIVAVVRCLLENMARHHFLTIDLALEHEQIEMRERHYRWFWSPFAHPGAKFEAGRRR